MKWIYLGGAIVSEVTGSLALKAGLENGAWYILVTVGYVAAFVFITRAMRRGLPLGVSYGIWGALGVAATALFGVLLFGETLTLTMVGGLVLVVAGVLTVQLGSQRAQKAQQARTAKASTL
ncbi:MAG TPA: multidrug efflux SMR transporter [Pseudolysinimonas sp.]|nr:multidrug efflux SMR transporter [Pseudolysinimonas sp.]